MSMKTTEKRICPFNLELLEECSIRKDSKRICPFTLEPCLQPISSTSIELSSLRFVYADNLLEGHISNQMNC
jgi:hypothetical protein